MGASKIDNLAAFRLAKQLHAIALSVGHAHSLSYYYQVALEFRLLESAGSRRRALRGASPARRSPFSSLPCQVLRFERRPGSES